MNKKLQKNIIFIRNALNKGNFIEKDGWLRLLTKQKFEIQFQ